MLLVLLELDILLKFVVHFEFLFDLIGNFLDFVEVELVLGEVVLSEVVSGGAHWSAIIAC